ncbi:MAG TPA: hypothetical protein VK610_08050 [Rhodothermales bacterium]|nr:hypothetical protein [Rhodothermales bacterium]
MRRLASLVFLLIALPAAAQTAPDLAACLGRVVPYAPGRPQRADSVWTLALDAPGGGALRYVGARHASDPADPQFASIEAAYRDFGPTVVFYEGPERPLEETADATIRAFGESGYVRFLARERGARVARLEPSPGDDFGAVAEALDVERASLFFLLRETARLRDRRGLAGAELDAAIASLVERAHGMGLPIASLDDMAAAYGRHFSSPADWRAAPSAWFDPYADDDATGGVFMAEANRASSHFRNLHMARVLAEAARSGERVFAVVGADHVPLQTPALRCALAAP